MSFPPNPTMERPPSEEELISLERENRLVKSELRKFQKQVVDYQLREKQGERKAHLAHQHEIEEYEHKIQEIESRARRRSVSDVSRISETEALVKKLRDELQEKDSLIEELRRQLESQKDNHSNETQRLQHQNSHLEREKRQLEASFRQDLSSMKETHQDELKRIKDRLRNAVGSKSSNPAPQLTRRISDLEIQLEELGDEHQEDIENLVEEHERELNDARNEMRERIVSLESENSTLRERGRELNDKVNELKRQMREESLRNGMTRRLSMSKLGSD